MDSLMLATHVVNQLALNAKATGRGRAIAERLRMPTTEVWLAIAVIGFGLVAAFAPVA
jgi:hypothetical protein